MPGDAWIFAYGSLMWRPGFPFLERRPALLFGHHRALCILSVKYRGTPGNPGLVLGLDRGGSCRGFAYRVAAAEREATLAYLDAREHSNEVYHARWLPIRLDDGRRVAAYCFVANHAGPQYAGRLSPEATARLVARGRGREGTASDYLENTLRHLADLGIADRRLLAILRLLPDHGG